MKNITVAVPERVYVEARIAAARRGSSVSALVAAYLSSLAAEDGAEDEFERLRRKEREIVASVKRFRAADRLAREELHERAVR